MNKIIFFVLFIIISVISYSQNNQLNVNFCITINDNLIISSTQRSFLIINNKNKIDTIECKYIPGELIIYDKEKILNCDNKIFLIFWYSETTKYETKNYFYKIEINKLFFNYHFIILRIYNLDKWKYRRIYYPLDGVNYTYEIDFPGYSMNRIKKR